MSAGLFTKSFYAATYATPSPVHPIKVQPETLEAECGTETNISVATATTNPIQCAVSRGRRSIGLIARIVYLQVTGTPPTGYAAGSRTKIPCMTEAFYQACLQPAAEVTYLGTTWKVIGSSPEIPE